MAIKFKIEYVFKVTGRGYFVTATLIENERTFSLSEKSKLGEVGITSYVDKPRAIDEDGNIRHDLWAFQIKNERDADKLQRGQIVELSQ
ncbi:MAG: hypothetical protein AAF673_05990 [Pseudomonadota bacterium]